MSQRLSIRREVVEYGSLPVAAWLSQADGISAVRTLLVQLSERTADSGTGMISLPALAECLDVPEQHAEVLVDTIAAVNESHLPTQEEPQGQPRQVDIHAVALFFFAQLYIRQAQRPDQMDVWPSQASQDEKAFNSQLMPAHQQGQTQPHQPHHSPLQNGSQPGQQEPVSPARSNSSRSSAGSQGSPAHFQFQQSRSNHLVRKELQQHLYQHQQQLHGYIDYVQRHSHQLLTLVVDNPSQDPNAAEMSVSAKEFDRLGLLLRPADNHNSDQGSPMEISPSPFTEDVGHLSMQVPLLNGVDSQHQAPLADLAEWLSQNLQEDLQGDAMVSSPTHPSRWGPLAPAGIVESGVVDVQGVCKSTVAKGEDDFPDGVLRITDCHDSVIYALAPLQYASITCCSDCTVVVGAVGRMLRVERCERLQLIAGCVRICISSCHDCIFYLGVNRPPLMLGDNRFVQLAPYCTQYERLAAHLESAGVAVEPNLWDQPVSLAREHRHLAPDSPKGPDARADGSLAPAGPRLTAQLLPAHKLLPFMVPFRGGPGSLCGGAATLSSKLSADLGAFVGLAHEPSLGGSPQQSPGPSVCPFPMPAQYEEAKESKVQTVATLRNSIKSAVLDDGRKRELQNVIQSHFKEWVVNSGNMRQVYDLARMERGDGVSTPHAI
ncbi:TPA: hypothetical protein ACH3X3_009230 [Trebouxia sp. C0006]